MSLSIDCRNGQLRRLYVHGHKGSVKLYQEDVVITLASDLEDTEIVVFIPRDNATAIAARILELDGGDA